MRVRTKCGVENNLNMALLCVNTRFLNLKLSNIVRGYRVLTPPLFFRSSPILSAEPLKKKKKLDPAVIKMREDRRKRRLEKQIKKLENVGLKLKPIDELEVLPNLLREAQGIRKRESVRLSEEERDFRADIFKEWARYKTKQHRFETQMIISMLDSQEKAMNELKVISKDLYLKALELDETLAPWVTFGPVKTPPTKSYEWPDGEYVDITRKWE